MREKANMLQYQIKYVENNSIITKYKVHTFNVLICARYIVWAIQPPHNLARKAFTLLCIGGFRAWFRYKLLMASNASQVISQLRSTRLAEGRVNFNVIETLKITSPYYGLIYEGSRAQTK